MAAANARKTRRGRRKGPRNTVPWAVLVVAGVIVVAAVGALLYRAVSSDARNAHGDPAARRWQRTYWRTPIAPQGPAPATYAAPARGLLPEDCGLCHYPQYADWRTSIHGRTMGPGVTGQLTAMAFGEQASCLACHAPMSEQWPQLGDGQGGWRPNPGYDAALARQGLTCAACHLRGQRRHGPPATAAQRARGSDEAATILHGAPVRSEHFEASAFCMGCHQHAATALKINGKTVENTYNEWLASPYARQGRTCQSCHMPGRRHLFRGIHDPEMTRSGVTIRAEVTPARLAAGQRVEARLTLTNTGTGHAFPTYTTPAVFLKAAFLDAQGHVVPGDYYAEKVLQRRLDLSTSPWTEVSDTRLLPGESASLAFARVAPRAARWLYLWVWVEPDHFYTGFYRRRLRDGRHFPGADALAQALKNSLASPYLLFSKKVALAASP